MLPVSLEGSLVDVAVGLEPCALPVPLVAPLLAFVDTAVVTATEAGVYPLPVHQLHHQGVLHKQALELVARADYAVCPQGPAAGPRWRRPGCSGRCPGHAFHRRATVLCIHRRQHSGSCPVHAACLDATAHRKVLHRHKCAYLSLLYGALPTPRCRRRHWHTCSCHVHSACQTSILLCTCRRCQRSTSHRNNRSGPAAGTWAWAPQCQ
mmetsp:Transcript_93389/g.300660  ORF Transcript_93389/g.300660 Transcript_93389/m.300660 type:complete len:208 (+) Transcript_93389:284-907(+)